MTNEELNTALYEKMSAGQETYFSTAYAAGFPLASAARRPWTI